MPGEFTQRYVPPQESPEPQGPPATAPEAQTAPALSPGELSVARRGAQAQTTGESANAGHTEGSSREPRPYDKFVKPSHSSSAVPSDSNWEWRSPRSSDSEAAGEPRSRVYGNDMKSQIYRRLVETGQIEGPEQRPPRSQAEALLSGQDWPPAEAESAVETANEPQASSGGGQGPVDPPQHETAQGGAGDDESRPDDGADRQDPAVPDWATDTRHIQRGAMDRLRADGEHEVARRLGRMIPQLSVPHTYEPPTDETPPQTYLFDLKKSSDLGPTLADRLSEGSSEPADEQRVDYFEPGGPTARSGESRSTGSSEGVSWPESRNEGSSTDFSSGASWSESGHMTGDSEAETIPRPRITVDDFRRGQIIDAQTTSGKTHFRFAYDRITREPVVESDFHPDAPGPFNDSDQLSGAIPPSNGLPTMPEYNWGDSGTGAEEPLEVIYGRPREVDLEGAEANPRLDTPFPEAEPELYGHAGKVVDLAPSEWEENRIGENGAPLDEEGRRLLDEERRYPGTQNLTPPRNTDNPENRQ